MQYRPPKSEPGAGGVLSSPPYPSGPARHRYPPRRGFLPTNLPTLAKGSSQVSYWAVFSLQEKAPLYTRTEKKVPSGWALFLLKGQQGLPTRERLGVSPSACPCRGSGVPRFAQADLPHGSEPVNIAGGWLPTPLRKESRRPCFHNPGNSHCPVGHILHLTQLTPFQQKADNNAPRPFPPPWGIGAAWPAEFVMKISRKSTPNTVGSHYRADFQMQTEAKTR
ncbi:uncharacterized protein LOC114223952 [Eumetopias jubatus]|uniref:uncharacterized protein LOC114223952 n=1 Tax=Eumetopias jubatus TaxID=34886 RepID=UPI001015E20B|nr:uncharacterized protein LOC114223952 [Eumetopias jubatus]XP_027978794.1 uncharacterized protein LOC114223952 [Eumetopias jubatus]XP_027978795.1 uncharacterized protein LOC114223952 [Eumetopias jubatus]